MTAVPGIAADLRRDRRWPLLSVVLAVGRVERFLPECPDSVLGQPDPPGGAEVIAVDDASPDGCGRILDARALRAISPSHHEKIT